MGSGSGWNPKFRRELPLTFAYAKENGWVLDYTGRKHKALIKNGFRYSFSGSASDGNADKQILRHLKKYDATGDIHGRTEKT